MHLKKIAPKAAEGRKKARIERAAFTDFLEHDNSPSSEPSSESKLYTPTYENRNFLRLCILFVLIKKIAKLG